MLLSGLEGPTGRLSWMTGRVCQEAAQVLVAKVRKMSDEQRQMAKETNDGQREMLYQGSSKLLHRHQKQVVETVYLGAV